jgi:phosphopentomutase
MDICIKLLEKDFKGLCFINLVDFDMIYGHRRDIDGYARAVTSFDDDLGMFLSKMKEEDALIITADHGCDPGYRGSDHTRESVPLLVYGNSVMSNNNIGDRYSFADIAATIADNFEIDSALIDGTSFYQEIIK